MNYRVFTKQIENTTFYIYKELQFNGVEITIIYKSYLGSNPTFFDCTVMFCPGSVRTIEYKEANKTFPNKIKILKEFMRG